jgi:polyhydroxyalkanoate synthesis regulator protein
VTPKSITGSLKKYPNRRLYDTEQIYPSRGELVMNGANFVKLRDAKVSEDLATSYLQIIWKRSGGAPMFTSGTGQHHPLFTAILPCRAS